MAYKNLSDFPEIVARYIHKGEPTSRNAVVHAPCCGNLRLASEIIDVRDVPGTRVKGGGVGEERDHDWLCSGCRSRMIRDKTNDWTDSKLLRARGGPAQHANDLEAREWLEETRRQEWKRDKDFPIDPQATYELFLDQITTIHRRDAEMEAASLVENVA